MTDVLTRQTDTMLEATASSRSGFDGQVRDWGQGVVESYLETRGRNDSAKSIKASIEEATGEYGGRFFVELLQNAHDAHEAGAVDGRVLMVLDDTKETGGHYGTVYVADAGRGFEYGNFRAISNLSLSNKPVGEGIGNKGVGFKSVLQVCEAPEIYSCDPQNRREDGYRFRFANEEDLRLLVPGDVDRGYVIEDVSRYTVPVPIDSVPAYVREFRDDGYSTVFRLPLKNAQAASEAVHRFEELVASTVPVGLFLNRVEHLVLNRRSESGERSVEVSRRPSPLLHAGEVVVEVVEVDEGRPYVVVTKEVEHERLLATITQAVRADRLKAKWLEWEGTAEVSLAVPVGWHADDWRLYTYLPMGTDAQSPIGGHLQAPFFADYSRTGIDAEHPLNQMLLDVCAELAVEAGKALLNSEPLEALADADLAAVAVDRGVESQPDPAPVAR